MNFNLLDLILFAILACGAYFGYRIGPLKGSITLFALIVSIVLAFRLMTPVGGAIARTGLLNPVHGAALTFVIVVAGCLSCAWVLSLRSGKPTSAKGWPRVAGSLIVFLQAALLISAMLLVLSRKFARLIREEKHDEACRSLASKSKTARRCWM